MESVFALIAALSALFAVTLGPLISLKVARDQIRLNTHSNNRQAWINSLRDTIAEYVSVMAQTSARSASQKSTDAEFLESLTKLAQIESKIQLYMNPREEDHQRLVRMIAECSEFCWRENVGHVDDMPKIARQYRDQIIALSQEILKREWERVKAVK